MKSIRILACIFLVAAYCAAQPLISANGVVNSASYGPQNAPSGGIAQGSLFAIFGTGLGPGTLTSGNFPYPTSAGLSGTTVQILTNTITVPCIIVYTSAGQVGAVLPSTTPTGNGTLTVTFNGQTSNAVPIRIVASSFGIFTTNQGGTGPGAIQNYVDSGHTPTNTVLSAATPGQPVILWGTGLGAVSGNEATGPLIGNNFASVTTVWVGGQSTTPFYAGRSGYPGVDQVNFNIPSNVSGCYVPVWVVVSGQISSTATVAIAQGGGLCNDSLSYSTADLQAAQAGSLRRADIVFDTSSAAVNNQASTTVAATFTNISPTVVTYYTGDMLPSLGTCSVGSQITGAGGILNQATPISAGAQLSVNGAGVTFSITPNSSGGYSGTAPSVFAVPGTYTVTGTGGSGVGQFSASVNATAVPAWTNASAFLNLSASSAPALTWTAGNSNGYAMVTLSSTSSSLGVTSTMLCTAPLAAGTFTLPHNLLPALVSSDAGGQAILTFGVVTLAPSFTAQGLNSTRVSFIASTSEQINFSN